MKRLKALLVIALFLTLQSLSAQNIPVNARNTVFIELGGNSFFYSLNFDHILKDMGTRKLTGRVGLMYLEFFTDNGRFMRGIPLEFSYLRGRGKNYLELGFGLTGIYDTYREYDLNELVLISVLRIGYRYQKPEGGLFIKAGLTPLGGIVISESPWSGLVSPTILGYEAFAYPFAGIAIGWTFRSKEPLQEGRE